MLHQKIAKPSTISFCNCSNIVKSVKKYEQCLSLQSCSNIRSAFLMYRNLQSRFKCDYKDKDRIQMVKENNSQPALLYPEEIIMIQIPFFFEHFSDFSTLEWYKFLFFEHFFWLLYTCYRDNIEKLRFFFLFNCFPFIIYLSDMELMYRHYNVFKKETNISQ